MIEYGNPTTNLMSNCETMASMFVISGKAEVTVTCETEQQPAQSQRKQRTMLQPLQQTAILRAGDRSIASDLTEPLSSKLDDGEEGLQQVIDVVLIEGWLIHESL